VSEAQDLESERTVYSGYFNPNRPKEDEELTHAGPGTPGGEYMRRFWLPVGLTSEVDKLPKRLRVLNEDLVAFRDKSGRIGLLHMHCAHRGASLEYGIPMERGLRCCYHGWTYDIDGTCLETPGEPSNSQLKSSVFQGAYPVRDYHGLLFAYMGPPDEIPDFPLYDALEYPEDNEIYAYALDYDCNWLQSHENGADPIHGSFLHAISSGTQFTEAFAALPVMQYFETPLGLISSATRRVGDNIWIRGSDMLTPCSAQFGSSFVDGTDIHYAVCSWVSRWIVPVDDTHNLTAGLRIFNDEIDPERKGEPELIGRNTVDFMGQTPERPYEERQVEPGDYEAQVGQGPVTAHAAEHLGSTDKGVLMTRRFLRQGIRAVGEGTSFKRPTLNQHGVVPTYNHEIVHRLPRRNDRDDTDLLAEFGARVAQFVIESADEHPQARQAVVERKIRDAFPA
jgi:nitrite reductase/ring-hydroxylating ferredoxin subunit